MQQKELASLLDISPAMVSRLAKRGMPTDTLERAERWRKRHLEPGRVKGSRFGTVKATARKPASLASHATPQGPAHDLSDADLAAAGAWLDSVTLPDSSTPAVVPTLVDLEAMGQLADAALVLRNTYAGAVRIFQLRNQLRTIDPRMIPRLSVRVWLALTDYMLHDESEVWNTPDMGELLTPGEFGERVAPGYPWTGDTVLWEACDLDDNALNGWPDGAGDDD